MIYLQRKKMELIVSMRFNTSARASLLAYQYLQLIVYLRAWLCKVLGPAKMVAVTGIAVV